MGIMDFVHENLVVGRRARVISAILANLIPEKSRVLDVGCGDGLIAQLILESRPDLKLEGIDVLVRQSARIPVQAFDGKHIPHGDAAFDVVMFVDVLHHADDPSALLLEACRVSRGLIMIKDHVLEGFLAWPILKFMDRVGNLRHGVTLRYDYWPRQRWLENFESCGIRATYWNQALGLYPAPARWIFERSLHFLARLEKGLATGGNSPAAQ